MIRTRYRFVVAFAFVLLIHPTFESISPAAVISNSGDSWARQSSPTGTFDSDLISVWATGRNDGGGPNARFGSIEFNLAGQSITAASLGLWSQTHGSSDDSTPHKQSAAILSNGTLGNTTGIPAHPLSWNDIAAGTLHPLEGLGKYDLPAVDATPAIQNRFLHSLATANDVADLSAVAAGDGRLILVLIADEDGTAYSKSWGDGEYGGQDGILATNADAVPEPAGFLLALVGFAATAVLSIRVKEIRSRRRPAFLHAVEPRIEQSQPARRR